LHRLTVGFGSFGTKAKKSKPEGEDGELFSGCLAELGNFSRCFIRFFEGNPWAATKHETLKAIRVSNGNVATGQWCGCIISHAPENSRLFLNFTLQAGNFVVQAPY
jgi:hypothetical protein